MRKFVVYISASPVRGIKTIILIWAGHVATMEEETERFQNVNR